MGTRRFEREFHRFRSQCREHCRAGTFFDADAMKALERHEGPPMEQVLAVVTADSSLRSERPMACPQPKSMPRQSAPAKSMPTLRPSSSPPTALAVVPPEAVALDPSLYQGILASTDGAWMMERFREFMWHNVLQSQVAAGTARSKELTQLARGAQQDVHALLEHLLVQGVPFAAIMDLPTAEMMQADKQVHRIWHTWLEAALLEMGRDPRTGDKLRPDDAASEMNPMPAPKDAKRARWHAVEAHLPASLPQMQPAPAVQQQTRADAGADTISVVDSMDGGKPLASPARSSGENLRGDPARLERTRGASGENQGSAGTANGSY